jgi:murein DD-endopeptidase MepM/ murein hydrolase activator NlpD
MMKRSSGARRRIGAVSAALSLICLLVACAPRVDGPAPVVSGGPAERNPLSMTVQHGQTLSGIAQTYHVPMRVIAEANQLPPPYRIQAGRTLIIPGAGEPRVVTASVAALPSAKPDDTPPPVTKPDLSAVSNPREAASAGRPPPGSPEKPPVVAAPVLPPVPPEAPVPPALPVMPPSVAGAAPPAGKPAPVPPASAMAPTPPAPPAASEPSAVAPPGGGNDAFLWPVRGHVLATYGSRTDGTHNDGINIAAPKGAAVQAADAGVVAYTGNELRGYGNLILVKHANGWISAYAHCDLILVKRGEKVTRGQVIARVGSTGNVSEPQLHFELRRGNRAVDPREVLAPLPTAATKDSRSG